MGHLNMQLLNIKTQQGRETKLVLYVTRLPNRDLCIRNVQTKMSINPCLLMFRQYKIAISEILSQPLLFPLMNALVYVDIDQGIH